MTRVLLTGAGGQLGRELQRSVPGGIELLAMDHATLDITDPTCVARVRTAGPQLIINAAAYTAVDRAEQERERAYAVNADGAAHLAEAAAAEGVRLIQVSTDFVFDGSRSSPYPVGAETAPLGVYGASKCAGEERVRAIVGDRSVILRTAWLYSCHGDNFVRTMLRLMRERDRLGVVADQVGSPTWARGLAEAIWSLAAAEDTGGTWHWTDLGVASWYDFAVAIQEEALALGLLSGEIPITPLTSADYPTPARRPAYSVLDKSDSIAALGARVRHWRQALREMLGELQEAQRCDA